MTPIADVLPGVMQDAEYEIIDEEGVAEAPEESEAEEVEPELPPSIYPCETCGKEFGSPQQLGGHKRHCKGKSATEQRREEAGPNTCPSCGGGKLANVEICSSCASLRQSPWERGMEQRGLPVE
jgi:hypothetical protein